MFTREDAALAYAVAAERLLGSDPSFLQLHHAVIPIFVTQLFQSLEISIKHVGLASKLITEAEARAREVRSGHGIYELARLVNERLQGESFDPLVQALTFGPTESGHAQIIQKMINGAEFERTRESYATRKLGYGEVHDGDFAVVDGLGPWVAAVKQIAVNLPKIVSFVSQWSSQVERPGPFAIWFTNQPSDGSLKKLPASD